MKFEWDPQKEIKNRKKHGVSFEEASYVFADKFALSIFDEEHSEEEERWILLGKSLNEVILVVVHTFRNERNEEIVKSLVQEKRLQRKKRSMRGEQNERGV